MLTNTMRTRLWQGSLAQPFSVHKNISGNEASFTRCAIRNGKSDSRQKKEYKNYMKKGEIYTGTVEKMDFPNKGILHIGEEKVVVKNALPGQTVEIAISRQRNGRCEGRLLKVVTPAAYENTEGACPHRADCGGCTYQTVPYEEQLKIKEQQGPGSFRSGSSGRLQF